MNTVLTEIFISKTGDTYPIKILWLMLHFIDIFGFLREIESTNAQYATQSITAYGSFNCNYPFNQRKIETFKKGYIWTMA